MAGNIVFLRGQVGQDLDTSESVGIGDPAAQAEQAMSNIARLLEEAGLAAGGRLQDRHLPHRHPLPRGGLRGRGQWLKGVHPVSTGLVVSALARPEWLVEIDATP